MSIQGNDGFLDLENASLRVTGNVHAEGLKVGSVRLQPAYSLQSVTNISNTTTQMVQFTNPTKGFDVTSNIEVGDANLFVDTTTGRVGIGVSNPSTKLHIRSGDVGIDRDQKFDFGAGYSANWYIKQKSADNKIYFGRTGGSENELVIDTVGYVGIGTATPYAKLHLVGVGTGSGPKLRFETLNNGNDNYTVSGTEIGGIQFGADDYGWTTQHMSSEIVGIHDTPNYSGARGILAFKTSSSQGSSPTEKMRIGYDGNVGIGTATPRTKFHVSGGVNPVIGNGQRAYFRFDSSAYGIGFDTQYWGETTSIYATHVVACGSYFVSTSGTIGASDKRIKKEIVDVEDDSALETLRLLKPKKYKYVDEVQRGTEPVWGFIAQEVRETLPYATQLRTDCLPNIYELANVSASNVITFTNFDTSNLESNAMVLKVFDGNDTEHLVNITEVVDDHSVRVEEDLSEWTGSIDESGNVVAGNQLFVYGQQVDDFTFLKKDAIWTVATSALQEVDRQLQAEKAKVTTLETQVADLLARVQTLESAVSK
jgi:hypothetical protein